MSSAAAFKEAGNNFLKNKQFDEAIKAYTEAINLEPTDHVFFSNRSAAYLSKGEAMSALNDGSRCITLSPNWPKGYSRKGAALHALRRYDEAIETYEAGLKIAPTDDGLKSGLAEVQKVKESASSAPSSNPMGGLFSPQMLAKLAGHPKFGPKLADKHFMMKLNMAQQNPQMLMSDPEMMEVLSAILGVSGGAGGEEDSMPSPTPSFQQKKEPEPAEMDVEMSDEERAVKASRDASNAAKERGNALYKAKSFQEAIAAYDEAVTADPTNLMVLNNKAAVFIEMNELDAALALCQDIIERASSVKLSFEDRAKVYQRMAAAHTKRNDIPAAIAAYGKSQMEKHDKAVERKMKTLELDLKKANIANYINPELGAEAKERGNAAFREGDFPKAIAEYEEAVKRDPKNPSYHNNLSAAYLKMGLFNDAKKEVEKSLELDRNYVKAWAKKGDIEFFMKEYHKSLESYKAGLQIEPDNSLCKQGLQKTMAKIQEGNGGEMDKERAAHAMADPEIQQILMDPSVRQVLTDFEQNPKFAQQAMNDPDIRRKIEKLIAAGVIAVK